MTDRTVKVSLVANVSNLIQGMKQAADEVRKTGSEAEKLAKKKEAFTQLGTAALAMGAVAAAGVAIAIKKFADWDAQMAQVQTLSHATADDMDKLRDASLNMGQAIGFSATEVADAETELVKAGISVKDMLGGALAGALDLAAAGQINVADATSIAASAMTQFQLKGKDVPHIADLLAAGADKALGSVSDLGQGLKYVGPIAQSMGISIEQTVGTLSLFAQNGILADQAGTGLRGVLLSLTSPSKVASDVMKQYGINLYDAQGKFIGVNGAAQQLKDGLGGLDQATRDQALGQIFGNQQITEAAILMDGGAKAVDKWTKAVDDQGFAAEQARGKMDSLNGDLSKLGAAFDTALIKTGSGANSVLRGLVEGLTDVTHWVGALPQPVLTAALGLTGLVAAIGLVGGGALIAVPKIAQFKVALETLGLAGPRAAAGVAAAGGAIRALPYAAVLLWLAQMGSGFVTSSRQALGLEQSVDSLTKKLSKKVDKSAIDSQLNATVAGIKTNIDGLSQLTNTGWLAGTIKSSEDFISTLQDWNPVLKSVGSGTGETTRKVADLDKSLADMVRAGNGDKAAASFAYLKTKTDGSKEALANLSKLFPEYAAAQEGSKKATDESADSVKSAGQAYLDSASQVNGLKDEVSQLTDEVNKANGVGQDAVSANASYQDALAKVQDTIDKAKKGVKDYSTSLDASTAAGADNIAMFSDQAAKSQDAAKAQLAVDGNTQGYLNTLAAGRQKLIDNIVALGGTAEQAGAVADQVYRIPPTAAVKVLAETLAAQRALDEFNARFIEVTKTRVAHILVEATNPKVGFGLGDGHAYGGAITGPGGPRDDRAGLYPLSNGEHVFTSSDVDAMGGQGAVYRFRANLHRGFADGGAVAPTYVPASSYAAAPTVNVPTPQFTVVVQSKGGIDLTQYVDVKIQQSEQAQARRTRMG